MILFRLCLIMIVVFDEQNQNQPFILPLIDFHTHIGRVKIETTKGTSQRVNHPQDIINLYKKLKFEIYKRIEHNKSEYYITLPPTVKELSNPLYPVVKRLLEFDSSKIRGWLVDHIVCFPFNDIFHTQTNPKFIKSNQYVRHQIQNFDNSFRFLPFCRVDATDDGAAEEVRNSIGLGMRGLKLHPMSQGWIDKIVSQNCKEVLQTTGELGIPTIFDVPNKGVAIDITTISEEARQDAAFPINVILGHSGFDYSSPEIFMCLTYDEMFVETSGMRGKDVEIFFNSVVNVPNWEEKILFGTDHNYFSVLQAADFITFLFSHKFKTLVEENSHNGHPLEAARKILGGNALRIIPPAWSSTKGTSLQKNDGFSTSFSTLHSSLKKYFSTKNHYTVVDLATKKDQNSTVQIFTIGRSDQKESYILETDENYEKIHFLPMSDNLNRIVDFPKSLILKDAVSKKQSLPLLDGNALLNTFKGEQS